MIINAAGQGGYLTFISDGPDDGCMDLSCFVDYLVPGITFGNTDGHLGELTIVSSNPFPGPLPDTFSFAICAPQECWYHFPYINWYPSTGGGPIQFHVYLCEGGGEVTDCGSCDRVEASNSDCATDVCFEHFNNNPLTTFTLHFNPPLRPCNIGPIGNPCGLKGITGPHGWPFTLAGSDGMGDDSELVFTADGGYAFTGCGQVCIEIPQCAMTHPTTITVTDGYECIDSGATDWLVPLKQADGGSMGEQTGPEQNYPNPLDAASGFKTTIPFTTSATGIATIRIVDQTGKEVMNESEEATYSGTHFFYFTATDLPSGTFYYQIEFPQGVVIQNKTMLVVK